MGRTYKCGSCGCPDARMDDFAYACQCKWRSLADLQALVLAGKYGARVGTLKAFAGLKVAELREELHARGIWDTDKPRKELEEVLAETLKGAQRVPSLLVTNPCQSLEELNLSKYAVVDCEPLHDLKGHLQHLLSELPHIFHGRPHELCQDLLQGALYSRKEGGYTGTDLRVALLEVSKLVSQLDVDDSVKLLVQTAVKISQILYSCEEKRTPKAVLQLYNCTWMHYELCQEMVCSLRECSRKAFFGIYLHALVMHAPVQYEVVCLRSVNTENQERIFQQAKQIAKSATNRQPSNVIPTLLPRLQAKQLTGKLSTSMGNGETRVQKAAFGVLPFPGTVVSEAFIRGRSSSWQAHLERISSFLLCGQGVWWEKVSSGYRFFDGDEDLEFRQGGPPLLHFRSTALCEVSSARKDDWVKVLRERVVLPTTSVRVFDEKGELCGRREFCSELPVCPAVTPVKQGRGFLKTSTPTGRDISFIAADVSGIEVQEGLVELSAVEPGVEGLEVGRGGGLNSLVWSLVSKDLR